MVKFFALNSFVMILALAHISSAKPLQIDPPTLRLLAISKTTKKPLANKAVEIYSDNGIRCVKAPCATNGINWKGKTDKHGYLMIPSNIRQASMTIEIAGYEAKELNHFARKISKNSWVIALPREY